MLALISLIFSLSFFSAPKAQAWDAIPAAILNASIKILNDTTNGFMLGVAKQAAVRALNQEVNFMITGRSSQGALFVTDWHDYLVNQPQKKTRLYMNAYIDQATSGRGSISQYIPANSEGFGLNVANYNNQLKVGAVASVVNPATPKVTYVGNPSQMFAQGNFRNLSLYLSGINNPWAFNLHMQEKFDETRQNEQLTAQQKAQAGQGFLGTESNGKTITPGILVKEQAAGVQDLGNKIIAGATHVPEVITAVVSQMVSQSITQGIGMIQASVHSEVANVRSQTTSQMNAAVQQLGPGAQYAQKWALGASSSTTCGVPCNGTGAHFAASCNSSTELGTAACPLVSGKQYCCIPNP